MPTVNQKGIPKPFWTEEEIEILRQNYPIKGKLETARLLNRTEAEVRYKASHLGLKLDRTSEFWIDFQRRAAQSKVGKKRPDQSVVMKKLHADGKLIRTAEQNKAMGERQRNWIKKNGHPRGALGMKHSPETRLKLAESSLAAWNRLTPDEQSERILRSMKTRASRGNLVPNGQERSWKSGWREIGGKRKFYRSRWEANYARLLEWQKTRGEIADWSHEPETFWFDGIKRGCVSYLPDFKVTFPDGRVEYHEVKGWYDDRSKTKIKRMAKYHPDVTLKLIDSKSYKQLERLFMSIVPGWELESKRSKKPAELSIAA